MFLFSFSRETCRTSHSMFPYLCLQRDLRDTLSRYLCPKRPTGPRALCPSICAPRELQDLTLCPSICDQRDPQDLTLCPSLCAHKEKGIREAFCCLKEGNIPQKIEENFIKQLPRELPASAVTAGHGLRPRVQTVSSRH